MLRFFDNGLGCVLSVFFHLESLERATAEQLFLKIDKNISQTQSLSYDKLVGLGTDGANVMLGQCNSIMSQLRAQQLHVIATATLQLWLLMIHARSYLIVLKN